MDSQNWCWGQTQVNYAFTIDPRAGYSMSVAHDARDFPGRPFFLPDVEKLERAADFFSFFVVAEAMGAGLDGAVVFDRINLESSADQFAAHSIVLCEHPLKTGGNIAV